MKGEDGGAAGVVLGGKGEVELGHCLEMALVEECYQGIDLCKGRAGQTA